MTEQADVVVIGMGVGGEEVAERLAEAGLDVIGTGTQPAVPPVPGIADVAYWTNREAIETKEVPGSLVVLGAGSVGAELGQVFARFGSDVTVIEALERVLPIEEPEASQLVAG